MLYQSNSTLFVWGKYSLALLSAYLGAFFILITTCFIERRKNKKITNMLRIKFFLAQEDKQRHTCETVIIEEELIPKTQSESPVVELNETTK